MPTIFYAVIIIIIIFFSPFFEYRFILFLILQAEYCTTDRTT